MPELLWLYARSEHRIGPNRIRIPVSAILPPFVRRELVASGEAGAEFEHDTHTNEMQARLSRDGGKVLGLALVRPLWLADVTRTLSVEMHALRDYYLLSK